MANSKFSLTQYRDERIVELVKQTDKKVLALWAIDCAERVLPYFEAKFPNDPRPRNAINTLIEWLKTGIFSMKMIRKASLDSHAAAKEIGNDSPAASAAHAAGQAVATAHVSSHAMGSGIYALQAIHKATNSIDDVLKEKEWQYKHLLKLKD